MSKSKWTLSPHPEWPIKHSSHVISPIVSSPHAGYCPYTLTSLPSHLISSSTFSPNNHLSQTHITSPNSLCYQLLPSFLSPTFISHSHYFRFPVTPDSHNLHISYHFQHPLTIATIYVPQTLTPRCSYALLIVYPHLPPPPVYHSLHLPLPPSLIIIVLSPHTLITASQLIIPLPASFVLEIFIPTPPSLPCYLYRTLI